MKIYNAQIYTMDNGIIDNGWIEIKDGIITEVQSGKPEKISKDDIDAQENDVIPGFVDAHTHMGIIENGIAFEGDDCNEQTDPFTPHLRVIDGVNPFDYCFKEAVKRGITSVLTCPGSANPCGGSIIAIKTYGRRVDDMLIKTAGIKFALGENPKTVYNDRDETPVTRMGVTAVIREGLYKAKKYYDDIKRYENDSENYDMPEYDMKCEALIPLVSGKIKAHFHCHRADDMCTAIRIAKEFDLDAVIVHGTEGHLIADILHDENIPVISGPVLCDRCKPEMRDLKIENTAILYNNHVRTAICTDHPVIPVQYLPVSASLAVKGGMPYYEALRAITLMPAEITGISDRVGSITVGKDADIQIYSRNFNPLDIMAEPYKVFVSGKEVI
jgi:imidazolonepropionase-like amidohydrolase